MGQSYRCQFMLNITCLMLFFSSNHSFWKELKKKSTSRMPSNIPINQKVLLWHSAKRTNGLFWEYEFSIKRLQIYEKGCHSKSLKWLILEQWILLVSILWLEYKRWCWLTEKGQADIVTHSTNIWNKVFEESTASKGFLSTQILFLE